MLLSNHIEKMLRKEMYTRKDNQSGIFYFSAADFPGMQVELFSFPSRRGHTLRGRFYRYPNADESRIVVFEHGIGNGHRAYMREIERLCRAGFVLFCYDHTGCMESDGENPNGFGQSLADLDDCLKALKQHPGLQGKTFSVVGHSWGGFSSMNIAAYHPDLTHVVAMSGFISVRAILHQFLPGLLKLCYPDLYRLEKESNPDTYDACSVRTLRNSKIPTLLIYSDNDEMVTKRSHYDVLKEKLSNHGNIHFLLVENRDHNPTYTREALDLKKKFLADLRQCNENCATSEQKCRFMSRYDFLQMTEQDETVWEVILNHLRSE